MSGFHEYERIRRKNREFNVEEEPEVKHIKLVLEPVNILADFCQVLKDNGFNVVLQESNTLVVKSNK